jgi:glycosyltransferase involved in cell wall biosynthesis
MAKEAEDMNVLFLSELFYPQGSGGELATYLWSKLLAEAGHNVNVVTNQSVAEPEESESSSLKIFRLPILKSDTRSKFSILIRFDVLLSNIIRKLLVWADVVYIPRFWYSAIPLAKAYGCSVITHLHGYIPACPLSTLYDLSRNKICDRHGMCPPNCIATFEMACGRNPLGTLGSSLLNSIAWRSIGKFVEFSDAVICVSQAQRNLIVARMPSLTGKCHVIYNPLPRLPRLEISQKGLGYFGGPDPLKGFSVLCSALRAVRSPMTVHMTGFDDRIRDQSMGRSRVVFHRRLSGKEYCDVYEKISTVVIPSISAEPLPYVTSEAILMGRLIIASNVGGIPEQAEGCPGVFLFQAGEAGRLAELLEYVNSMSEQAANELGSKNREVLLGRFDNGKALSEFLMVLDKVLG